MNRYVLVHGAWEGSWSWEDVIPGLEESGHQVDIVDLPGSFGNEQPGSNVTMESYVHTVVDMINKSDQTVILTGHSLGGAVISQVAEEVSEKIKKLIYVTAFLLKSGENALGAMQSDEKNELLPKIIFSEDQTYGQVSEETWREVAFHDAKEESILKALPRIADKQSTEPFLANLALTEKKFGSIPKVFVKTTLDKILTPNLQDKMIKNWDVKKVYDIESGHFPALSVPKKLTEVML